ncbi:hypothetical protein L1787_21085 [Acuticoccus sp. M5D2P5]|uniref:hypothetical protein n=1 Tax=Acuticoccus kalidii TaxID=2910977 RepID=UPI001F435665|nr:hypothetical protein [Acuticoccus kalidii]MCF3935888.1 hypothetical protein [Acuticoccus kalidii]
MFENEIEKKVSLIEDIKSIYHSILSVYPDDEYTILTPKGMASRAKSFIFSKNQISLHEYYFRYNKFIWTEICVDVLFYSHLIAKRVELLLDSCLSSIKEENYLASAIIARSILELGTAALADVGEVGEVFPKPSDMRAFRRRKIINSTNADVDIFDFFQKFIWGSRSRDVEDIFRRPQVYSKLVKPSLEQVLGEGAQGMLSVYENLSECVHPFRGGYATLTAVSYNKLRHTHNFSLKNEHNILVSLENVKRAILVGASLQILSAECLLTTVRDVSKELGIKGSIRSVSWKYTDEFRNITNMKTAL